MENASILGCMEATPDFWSSIPVLLSRWFPFFVDFYLLFYSPALSFMTFLCSSFHLSFGFYYSEYPNPVGKLCHPASHLIFQITHECTEHHHLLAGRPCQISASLPHTKLITYSPLYFVSCISIETIPLQFKWLWWRSLPKEFGSEVSCINQISLSPELLTLLQRAWEVMICHN